MYRDFRELLARTDIDAVLITTGDRWHALGSVLAAKAGKDVYCEKPCSMTIGESQILADVMRRYGRVFQVGTQRRSVGNFQFAAHLARSGKLGKLRTLQASIAYYKPQIVHEWLPAEPEPPKEKEDWDLWLRLVRAGAKPVVVDRNLGQYRLHGGSSSNKVRLHFEAGWKVFLDHYQALPPKDQDPAAFRKAQALHLYGAARKFSKLGQGTEARPLFLQSLKLNPFYPKVWLGWAQSFLQKA